MKSARVCFYYKLLQVVIKKTIFLTKQSLGVVLENSSITFINEIIAMHL